VRRVIDIAQGNVAKLIDAAAVQLLWRVARGRATEQERHVAAMFPTLLHVSTHVHLPVQQAGRVNSVIGTWSRDNLLDYFAAGPGSVRAVAPAGAAAWSAAIGTEAAFPTPLPAMTWLTREPGRAYAFVPAEREIFEADSAFLSRAAAWYRREGLRTGTDDRDREGALSAARIAELWLDSSRAGALEQLAAFELELRLRRMGMAAGDGFAQRFGWAHMLIGVDAVRAFNRILAPWVAATLMPEPFRVGLIDRGVAHAGLCAVLLAAGACAANLARAGAESASAPRSLPARGVKYAGPAGGDPPRDMPVHRLIRVAHGLPVFAPLSGHPDGLWEMFMAVRVERVTRPEVFRQPSPLAVRREMDSLDAIIVRVGPPVVPDSPASAAEGGQIETIFLSDSCTVDEANRQVAVAGGAAARALRAFWRMSR
jgi:hypothetical protein